MKITRRNFIFKASLAGAQFAILSPAAYANLFGGRPTALPVFFSEKERKILSKFIEMIYPDATKLGVIEYIENLLTAFEFDPPKIFAASPNYEDGAVQFVHLNRVQERAWRLNLYGSKDPLGGGGINEKITGPVTGLREIIRTGLETASPSFDTLTDFETHKANALIVKTDKKFQDALLQLVIEGVLSSPAYGGNKNEEGWKAAHYTGNFQPFGYVVWDENARTTIEYPDAPVSKIDPGPDPEPLTATTEAFLWAIPFFQQGKRFK